MAIATMAAGIGNYPSMAQIVPDTSLGAESSIVTPNVEVKGETADRIDGGAIRDRNLFHSFSEFNVGAAQQVYFTNPSNIEQIFTRVTGNNTSNIDGTLGVDGAADLLLLNPNGIIFGENSSLDVEGSFFGTSAESVLFEDETEFSALQPNSSLLTVSVPVGLQMGNNPGAIVVRSPLEMANGQNFSLVGGKISLSGGDIITTNGISEPKNGIIAPGGRVELGGLSTAGIINFENNSNLNFPEEISRADITFNNFAIDARAGGGGSIAVFSKNLRLTNSIVVAGIDFSVESTAAPAGDIRIDTVEETILAADEDSISAIINATGDLLQLSETLDEVEVVNITGDAGNIFIDTGSLSATGLSYIGSATNGEGNAGSININARESVAFNKSTQSNMASGISSTVFPLGTGNGANIEINAQSLSLDNAAISTTTLGAGNAGDITINVLDSIVANNSSIEAATFGSGNAGNIVFESETANITFENQTFVGNPVAYRISEDELSLSLPDLFLEGTGKGADIILNGRNLVVTEGVSVTTFTGGQVIADGSADASNIELNISDSIEISGNSEVSSDTFGEGNAGNLTVNTDNLAIENSAIFTNSNSSGAAGSIDISASQSINISGTTLSNGNRLPAGLYTITTGSSAAGDVTLNTHQLRIANGGQIQASTFGAGDGGSINIEANEIQLIGGSEDFPSIIAAVTRNSGNGGIVDITTDNLFIADGAGIGVSSSGNGSAGSIFALIDDLVELDDGIISGFSERSSGGAINLTAGDIRLKGDSNIQTNVENGAGGGGNITLTADSIVAFDDSDIFSFSTDGRGGNITLNADTFFGANYTSAALDANPQLLENNNRVDINATASVSGIVELPEIKFLPDSLAKLSEDRIDAEEVVANSCVVRSESAGGTFIVTGSEGLPSRPGDAAVVDYATGNVRSTSDKTKPTANNWQPGEPIVEPDKAYQLANGKLVLSRQCS